MKKADSVNEQRLASRLRQGDPDAFKEIYNRFWAKLIVVAAKRLDDVTEAEEVVQEIFLNLWRRRESFELKVSFENYFSVAVKFEVINRRAKRAREKNSQRIWRPDVAEFTDQPVHFDLQHLQKQLEHTINTLPPKCQLVFRLSRDDEYTNKEIAEQLGVSEKAVEKHITKALSVLRSRFGRNYHELDPLLSAWAKKRLFLR